MFTNIKDFVEGLETSTLAEERRQLLAPLKTYIKDGLSKQEAVNLNFICTHNSRRSQLGQVWGKVIAQFFGYSQIKTFSGGVR